MQDGVFLNDNELHTVTIFHSPENRDFEYVLDGGTPVVENYAAGLDPEFGLSGVSFGGIPPDSVLGSSYGSFIGCLENVQYGGGNITFPSEADLALQPVQPVSTNFRNGLEDGCRDPCEGVECGAGRCVSRWPDRAFCDCRDTDQLGETCSEGMY